MPAPQSAPPPARPAGRFFINEGPPGGVGSDGVRLHFGQLRRADEVLRLRRQGQVEGDDVALGENLVGGGAGDAVGLGVRLSQKGGGPAPSCRSPGPAGPSRRWPQAQDADGAAGHVPGGDLLPVALAAVLVNEHRLAGHRQEQGHYVVRHRFSVGPTVRETLISRGLGGVQINVVHPHAVIWRWP